MAWGEQWSIKVDGTEVNTAPKGTGPWFAEIPEITWDFEQQILLVEVDGDYPAAVGYQPQQGTLGLQLQHTPCDWHTWRTDIDAMRTLIGLGGHTFAVQVRGMAAPLSMYAIRQSFITADKYRRATVQLIAPRPVLS